MTVTGRGIFINEQESWDDTAKARKIVLVTPAGVPIPASADGIKVDTELVLNVDNLNVGNLKTGSTTGTTADTFLKTDASGQLETAHDINTNPLFSRLTDTLSNADVNIRTTTANGLNTLPLGEFRTTAPTLTNTQVVPLQVSTTGRLKIEESAATATTPSFVVIRDATISTQQAAVNSSGELKVVTPPPTAPPNTIPVSKIGDGSIGGTVDTLYVITNGKSLTIQRFSAGGQGGKFSVIELFEDPNGNLSVLNLIEKIYVGGNSFQVSLNAVYAGNGVRRILLRRRRLDGGAVEVTGKWEGYEQ